MIIKKLTNDEKHVAKSFKSSKNILNIQEPQGAYRFLRKLKIRCLPTTGASLNSITFILKLKQVALLVAFHVSTMPADFSLVHFAAIPSKHVWLIMVWEVSDFANYTWRIALLLKWFMETV
jgi:hypothetical protein